MGFRFASGSVAATVVSLHSVPDAVVQNAVKAALEDAGGVLARECAATLSHTDHTLAQLATGGSGFPPHPYARRHGKIKIHPEKPYIIHSQSGRLLRDGLKHGLAGNGDRYEVWLDTGSVPYAQWVIQGSKKMLGRDALWETAHDERVRRLLMRQIVRTLGKNLRSQTMLRFAKAGVASGLRIG